MLSEAWNAATKEFSEGWQSTAVHQIQSHGARIILSASYDQKDWGVMQELISQQALHGIAEPTQQAQLPLLQSLRLQSLHSIIRRREPLIRHCRGGYRPVKRSRCRPITRTTQHCTAANAHIHTWHYRVGSSAAKTHNYTEHSGAGSSAANVHMYTAHKRAVTTSAKTHIYREHRSAAKKGCANDSLDCG